MSIYATLWRLKFPRHGDDHPGCEWIDVVAQGVLAHISTPTAGFGYEREDPYAAFLPPAIAISSDDDGQTMRAVVFVTEGTPKGTDRSAQEYVTPLLVLSGIEYATIPFGHLHARICEALRGDRPRLVSGSWGPDGRGRLMFEDGSVQETAMAAKSTAPAPEPHVYQFNVALLEITPPIWRTIEVPETYTFWDLHVAIQDAMGWLDYHLHVFNMNHPDTGAAMKIGIPDDDPFEGDEPHLPGWDIPIALYFHHPGVVAPYLYDFGDGWQHEVTLEAIVPRQQGQKYPRCVGGARGCPPEDCGGFPGYEHLLAVMRDPTHEEYEDRLQWLGGQHDPETFDPRKVKFDDPAKRWRLAFGPPIRPVRPTRRRARSATNRPRRPPKRRE